MVDITVPAAGESVTEADISIILMPTGSQVQEDDAILELETDKATMPLNAPCAGRVEVLVAEGDTVKVGQVIARIDPDAVGTAVPTPKTAKAPTSQAESNKVTPALSPKVSGDVPESAPFPSARASAQVVAPKAMAPMQTGAVGSPGPAASMQTSSAGTPGPAASRLLFGAGIPSSQVHGTGKGGRITKADAIQAIANPKARHLPPPPTPDLGFGASLPQAITGEKETRKKMSRLRKVVAKRLVEAQHNAAMLTTFNEVDMSAVMDLRKKYKDRFKEIHGIGLGFMSFFVKAVVEALKASPDINAYIDGDDIVYRNYYDISVAVSTPKGLVVPVIRNCDKLSFSGVESSILDFALRGKEGTISTDEMQGGGFTITNGGIFGSLLSTPILNPPQSAILGMHAIKERPVVVDGAIVIRPMMYLALSYDHRIVDGKEAVTFLVKIKECLEDPSKIMLEL